MLPILLCLCKKVTNSFTQIIYPRHAQYLGLALLYLGAARINFLAAL